MAKPRKIQVHHLRSLRKMLRKALVKDRQNPGGIQIVRGVGICPPLEK